MYFTKSMWFKAFSGKLPEIVALELSVKQQKGASH
jgi:hypothetical protein